jgi:hypothetical protein
MKAWTPYGTDGIIVRGLRHFTVFANNLPRIMGRDSSVGIATRYGLDGLGIESWWGVIFRTRPDRPRGLPSLLYNRCLVFPGVKRPGRGVDHPPPSSAEVKEIVELYLYSPYGPSWPVRRCQRYAVNLSNVKATQRSVFSLLLYSIAH